MKSKTAKFLDNLVLGVAVWLLSALATRYYVAQSYLVIIIATLITMGVILLVRLKNRKNADTEKNNYYASLCAAHFLYADYTYALDYFFNALSKRYKVTKKRGFLRINNTLIAPSMGEPLTLKQAVFCYAEAKRENAKVLVILTPKIDKSVGGIKDRLNDLRLEIFESDRVYKLLKSLDSVPALQEKKLRRQKLKEFATGALNPKRAKGYLITSFVLLFGAYFSLLSLYFIAMAAVSLTMVLLCKLNIAQRFKKE